MRKRFMKMVGTLPMDVAVSFPGNERKYPGHVCRHRGEVVLGAANSAGEPTSVSPGDVVMLEGKAGTVVRGAAAQSLLIGTPSARGMRERIEDELDELGFNVHLLPDVLTSLAADNRARLCNPEVAANDPFASKTFEVDSNRTRKTVQDMSEPEAHALLMRLSRYWDKAIAPRYDAKWTHTQLREEAIRATITLEIRTLKAKAESLNRQIARIKPYASLGTGALKATKRLLRQEETADYLSPSEARRKIERMSGQLKETQRKVMSLQERLLSERVNRRDPLVAQILDRRENEIKEMCRGGPEGFMPLDGKAALGAAALVETLSQHIFRLRRENELKQAVKQQVSEADLAAESSRFSPM